MRPKSEEGAFEGMGHIIAYYDVRTTIVDDGRCKPFTYM